MYNGNNIIILCHDIDMTLYGRHGIVLLLTTVTALGSYCYYIIYLIINSRTEHSYIHIMHDIACKSTT